MRNRYSKEFEDFVRKNANKCTKEELRQLIQTKYKIKMSIQALRRYINRHNIEKCIDYKEYNAREVHKCPVGTEKTTPEGTFVKTSQPDVWRRKTRVMYEKYHNCTIDDDDYIVFLNQDRNDFSKENLMKVSKREMTYLYNGKTFSKNPNLTKLGILSARLKIKANGKLESRTILT